MRRSLRHEYEVQSGGGVFGGAVIWGPGLAYGEAVGALVVGAVSGEGSGMNEAGIAQRVAAGSIGDVVLETFYKYVVITRMGLTTRDASLDDYIRELTVAASQVNAEVMRVQAWARKLGLRATKRNVGITPDQGVVGVAVEFNRPVTPEEYSTL